ncbi:unnamed protein product [Acanthoscelides obtectus]|uniref:Uncharacterized protein n=1 Tax=Acanthoscelides obtectus TaxID=200917 RepID=A0A9P0PTL3_ACAOB|nr:unnamed protein product [Acanthoscelides obtectus]CAK1680261.1 hypothetical protein AOBTE_LOCUS32551 [Acanthoscelides obtectus]
MSYRRTSDSVEKTYYAAVAEKIPLYTTKYVGGVTESISGRHLTTKPFSSLPIKGEEDTMPCYKPHVLEAVFFGLGD